MISVVHLVRRMRTPQGNQDVIRRSIDDARGSVNVTSTPKPVDSWTDGRRLPCTAPLKRRERIRCPFPCGGGQTEARRRCIRHPLRLQDGRAWMVDTPRRRWATQSATRSGHACMQPVDQQATYRTSMGTAACRRPTAPEAAPTGYRALRLKMRLTRDRCRRGTGAPGLRESGNRRCVWERASHAWSPTVPTIPTIVNSPSMRGALGRQTLTAPAFSAVPVRAARRAESFR